MDSDSVEPGALQRLVRAALAQAVADEKEAPLLDAAGLILQALAADPTLAAALNAESLDDLLDALEAQSSNGADRDFVLRLRTQLRPSE